MCDPSRLIVLLLLIAGGFLVGKSAACQKSHPEIIPFKN